MSASSIAHASSTADSNPTSPAVPAVIVGLSAPTSTLNSAPITNGLDAPALSSSSLSPSSSSLRPAKDLAAFNSLLPGAVEFVEGSSSGTLGLAAAAKYEPINESPKTHAQSEAQRKLTPSPTRKRTVDDPDGRPIYPHPIDTTWPPSIVRGSGLINTGNTCFLNSALQCLLHTPPLLRVLDAHSRADPCQIKSAFCMCCSMRQVMHTSFERGHAFNPLPVTRNLNFIAKHLKRGRQEDSHEFLRYAIDSMQKACLAGHPPKLDHKITETTWVHKIFGGKLRSRVTCQQCGHNSDTFDSMLDLSLDIYNMNSIKDALRRFTAPDYLKGADRYKCEKCERPVNAEKRFTIHEAPAVLTVHLKRFTPLGRKLQHPIRYDEHLSLQPSMSDGQYGPTYLLYGVICHVGSGPSSGHYYAYVRGGDSKWYEMNDDAVERIIVAPTNRKSAYILFYIREKGQVLEAVLNSRGHGHGHGPTVGSTHLGGAMKRRNLVMSEDEDEDSEEETVAGSGCGNNGESGKVIIGPVIPEHLRLPNGHIRMMATSADPQADMLKRKIESVERSRVTAAAIRNNKAQQDTDANANANVNARRVVQKPLVDYEDESSGEEEGERVDRDALVSKQTEKETEKETQIGVSGRYIDDDVHAHTTSPMQPPTSSSVMDSSCASTSAPVPIPPKSFYGSSAPAGASRKRKSPGDDEEEDEPDAPTPSSSSNVGETSTGSGTEPTSLLYPSSGSVSVSGTKEGNNYPQKKSHQNQNKNKNKNGRKPLIEGAAVTVAFSTMTTMSKGGSPFTKGRMAGNLAGAREDREERELMRPRAVTHQYSRRKKPLI